MFVLVGQKWFHLDTVSKTWYCQALGHEADRCDKPKNIIFIKKLKKYLDFQQKISNNCDKPDKIPPHLHSFGPQVCLHS